MFKRIGLSTAAIVAAVTLAQAPAAMAADRDDFRYRNTYAYGDRYYNGDFGNSRVYHERAERRERERREHQRFEWREHRWRNSGYRDYGYRDYDRDWR